MNMSFIHTYILHCTLYNLMYKFSCLFSMPRPEFLLLCICLILFGPFVRADIGLASQYFPPYTPTACFGNDLSQFPTSNLFVAAGEGVWDNGAACGRQYLVRCINGPAARSCVPGQTIQVRVVDRARTSASRPTREGASLVLSNTAYQTIAADRNLPFLNVEFLQV